MCTLTVAPLPGGRVRLAFNRDERPTRRPALAPARRRFGVRDAILPTDPASGGTWLAVNDAGLALAVLNVTTRRGQGPGDKKPGSDGPLPAAHCSPTPARSRGEIIPALLECPTPAAALEVFERAVRLADFAPFRLVLVGDGVGADVRWDGSHPMVMNRLLGATLLLFTSSGLGDHLVEGVRRELFDEMFGGPADGWEAAQDAFHRHRWPGREHLSVNMTRPTARTVSHSVIELAEAGATFSYHPAAPDAPADRHVLHLPFSPAGGP